MKKKSKLLLGIVAIVVLLLVIVFSKKTGGEKSSDPKPSGGTGKAVITASPSGGAVASGTAITLTVTPAGAEIYYTQNGSMPSAIPGTNNKLYSDENKPIITANTLQLRTWTPKGATWGASEVTDFTYTIE